MTPRMSILVKAASRYGVGCLGNLGYFSRFFPVFEVRPRITRKLVCVCIPNVYIFWMLYLLATKWHINYGIKLLESRAWLPRVGVGRVFSFIKWKIGLFGVFYCFWVCYVRAVVAYLKEQLKLRVLALIWYRIYGDWFSHSWVMASRVCSNRDLLRF